MKLPFELHSEIERALACGQPVVALESTIITHGMPHPQNLETARAVEAVIRGEGAVPATIAVIDGALKIGLGDNELELLARAENVLKLSRADLPFACATGATGSLTVAATMIAANLAGIEVFATGGIGGVHRGAEHSFDVSADLTELARTPVAVVAAGAKAILDIPKTLEVLETHGVTVITIGQDEFPAFWSRQSGLPSPLCVDRVEEICATFRARRDMNIAGGMLVANPIPTAAEIPADIINPLIDQAIAEAEAQGVATKALTPFLLDRIFRLTDGRSLVANIELVKHNAKTAAKLAQILVKTR